METKNYRGKVKAIHLKRIDAFGERTFEVEFQTGKAMYRINSHERLSFAPGDIITFKCRKISLETFEFFHITEVLDINDVELFLNETNKQLQLQN